MLAACLVLAGCGGGESAPAGKNPYGIRLTDVTREALGGLLEGGRTANDADGFNYGFGTGAAIGDVDGDGDLDLVLVRDDDPRSDARGGPTRLYRNLGGMKFQHDAGFDGFGAGLLAHGAALGDLEPDGDLDLFLATEGADLLLENDGRGGFTDVTARAGVAGLASDLGLGGVFADVSGDGLVDLIVINFRSPDVGAEVGANRLYVNRGDGTFADVGAASGAASPAATWTAAAADLDGDRRLDLYLANDQFFDPSHTDQLFAFQRVDGDQPRFLERAAAAGVNDFRTTMGVAVRDVDGDGKDDVYVSNWGPNSLFLARGTGFSHGEIDHGVRLGFVPGFGGDYLYVSWAARFLDLDRDGGLELMVVNGGLEVAPNDQAYRRQQDVFLRSPARGRPFADVTELVGWPAKPGLADTPLTGRGLAVGDLDADGDDDFVVTPFVESFRIYRNDTPSGRHAVRLRLRGTVSASSPVGAIVMVDDGAGFTDRVQLYAGGDVHSWSDDVVSVGLGERASARVTIAWPSGIDQRVDRLPEFALDRTVTISEPRWLSLSARSQAAGDPAPALTITLVAEDGAPLGAAGTGRSVFITRSDGLPAPVIDRGDGSYLITLPHPGSAQTTALTIVIDGQTMPAQPSVRYL